MGKSEKQALNAVFCVSSHINKVFIWSFQISPEHIANMENGEDILNLFITVLLYYV